MFSTNLRKRSFWQALSPFFATHKHPKLKEIQTDDFDLAVGDNSGEMSTHVLLVDSCQLHDEYQSLNKWVDSNAQAYRIVMLVSSKEAQTAAGELQELQLHMIDKGSMVPVLYVPNIEHIMTAFEAFYNSSIRPSISSAPEPAAARVMSYCTSSAPRRLLSDQEIRVMKQICGSIEGLEKATRMPEGQKQLYQHLGSTTTKALIEFWEDEWIA